MALSMFSGPSSPIAIDFGSASVKLLQVAGGNRPEVTAAAELPIPDGIRLDADKLFEFYAVELPKILSKGKFRGKRAMLAIPSNQTFVQHMQLVNIEGASRDDLIKGQLQTQMGCQPQSIVVRWVDVAEVHRNGQARSEVICFAIARDTVMRYVELLKKNKLKTVGVHTETMALVRSFQHLSRRQNDQDITTLYVDMGWGGTRMAIAHGRQIAFARAIQLGGRSFDQYLCSALNCDMAAARSHRLALDGPAVREQVTRTRPVAVNKNALLQAAAEAQARDGREPEGGGVETAVDRRAGNAPREFFHEVAPGAGPPKTSSAVDLTELLDTVTDEMSMCLRYHQGLFPNRSIDRAIFLGGEAKQVWLCQHVVRTLRVPGQLGDPIARLSCEGVSETPGVNLAEPQPGWAVACGLTTAPTDL